MKKILLTILVVFFVAPQAFAFNPLVACPGSVAAADYCSSQTWATLSSFKLDFDHATPETACLSTGTEVGTLSGATIATPATVSPGSGGAALLANANSEVISFDNALPYFRSLYGEIYITFFMSEANTATDYLFKAEGVAFQDELRINVNTVQAPGAFWEDNNGGSVSLSSGFDMDADCGGACYAYWIQVHVKWDTTRCSDGADTCDGVGEDELGVRVRYYNAGWQAWSSWAYETSALDFEAFSSEPTAGEILTGITSNSFDATYYIDDVEISYNQPSW